MKKLFVLVLCLALVLSMAACGSDPTPTTAPTTKPTTAPTTAPTTEPTTAPTTEPAMTAEDLYAEIKTAMENNEATKMAMDMSFSISYEEGEGDAAVTTTISYKMLLDTVISTDPFGAYALSAIEMGTEGFSMDVTVDMYIVEEDGQAVMYMQVLDAWTRSESGMTVAEFLTSGEMTEISTEDVWSADAVPADMVLEEDTVMMDGTEVYVLHANISGGITADALAELGVELEPDGAEIMVPVTYYVDAQNYTILKMDAEMAALSDLLAAAMVEDLLGVDSDPDALTIDFPNAVYTLGYGPQEVPAVPQEAFDYIANDQAGTEDPETALPIAGEASDLGDGTFVLPCGDEAIQIATPAGWIGMVYDYNNIWIYAEDETQSADIYYLDGYTEDDILYNVQLDEAAMKDYNIFLSSGDGPVYEGYTTAAVMGMGESYCYAWTEMGEGYLLVLLGDYTAEPDFETQLNDLMALISPYTGEFQEYVGASDLGDGRFSLPCGSETVILACPKGWYGSVSMDTAVGFYNDYAQYADFYYLDGYTEEDVMDYWIQYDVDMMKSDESFISFEEADIEMYSAWVLRCDNMSCYYAYRQVGDGCLLLQIMDLEESTADGMEVFRTMIDCISYE